VLSKRRKQAASGARRAFPLPFCAPKFVCWLESNCCDQYLTTTAESALNGIIVERASERARAALKYAAVSTDVLNKKPISLLSLASPKEIFIIQTDGPTDGRARDADDGYLIKAEIKFTPSGEPGARCSALIKKCISAS
jgi:hypothetical protein